MDMSKYRELFFNEAREHIETLNSLAVRLEKTPGDVALVENLFREAHSVKGMAATMGFESIARLAHQIEGLLETLRNADTIPTQTILSLFKGIDLLEVAVISLQTHGAEQQLEGFEPSQVLTETMNEMVPNIPPASVMPLETPFDLQGTGKINSSETVRVRADLVDRLVNQTGELITQRNMLKTAVAKRNWGVVEQCLQLSERLLKDLNHQVLQVRLMPFAHIAGRLQRIARDLGRQSNKDITFNLTGSNTYLDRSVLEKMTDPLIHLVRNAIDHGIENVGEVNVTASREKGMILIEVSDNGKGIEPSQLLQRAFSRGLITTKEMELMSDRDALMLICKPGFSTVDTVTEISGRGVGMDVVKDAVTTLGGTLDILSTPGQGTQFQIRLPISVAVIKVLLVKCSGQAFAIPMSRVRKITDLPTESIQASDSGLYCFLEDLKTPLLHLSKALQLPEMKPNKIAWTVLMDFRNRTTGLLVDEFLGQKEAFIKPLGYPMNLLPGLSGATIDGEGEVVFLIDPIPLLEKNAGQLLQGSTKAAKTIN